MYDVNPAAIHHDITLLEMRTAPDRGHNLFSFNHPFAPTIVTHMLSIVLAFLSRFLFVSASPCRTRETMNRLVEPTTVIIISRQTRLIGRIRDAMCSVNAVIASERVFDIAFKRPSPQFDDRARLVTLRDRSISRPQSASLTLLPSITNSPDNKSRSAFDETYSLPIASRSWNDGGPDTETRD